MIRMLAPIANRRVAKAWRSALADALVHRVERGADVWQVDGGAVCEGGDVIEEGEEFFVTEDDGEFIGSFGAGEVLAGPGHFESGEVDELEGGGALINGFGGVFAFVEEVELVVADVVDVED